MVILPFINEEQWLFFDECLREEGKFFLENTYEVWIEGYMIQGGGGKAHQLKTDTTSLWSGQTFQEACKKALKEVGYNMSLYDKERNTHWGCKLYDNEKDARRAFG